MPYYLELSIDAVAEDSELSEHCRITQQDESPAAIEQPKGGPSGPHVKSNACWEIQREMKMGKTLFEKIWSAHVVREMPDGSSLLYIDRNLVLFTKLFTGKGIKVAC